MVSLTASMAPLNVEWGRVLSSPYKVKTVYVSYKWKAENETCVEWRLLFSCVTI
jgi:hypothetical protein